MNLKLHLRLTCVLHEVHTVDINNIQYAYMHVILQFWTVYAVAWEDAFTGSLDFAQVQLCTVTVHCMWSDEMNLPIIFLQTQTSSLKVSWVLTYFIFNSFGGKLFCSNTDRRYTACYTACMYSKVCYILYWKGAIWSLSRPRLSQRMSLRKIAL